jgi:uncharacterized protein (TIGR03435 family)
MRRAIILLAISITALAAFSRVQVRAQSASADAKALAFEVASVKPNKSGTRREMMSDQPGGRFTASNVTLHQLVLDAYQLQSFQLTGGPSWVASDRFDIEGKAGIVVPDDFAGHNLLQLMLRSLLVERFKLAVHNESRELPVYALVMARSDGRMGPKLVRSSVDCAATSGRGNTPPVSRPTNTERPTCGMRTSPGNLTAGAVPVALLVNILGPLVNRPILNRTGLTGSFDIDLTWTPDQPLQRPPGADEPPVDPNGPSIFTAVQEQLGLKLESTTGPIDVVVIDSVQHPTAD